VLAVIDVAEILGTTDRNVTDLAKRGTLPATKRAGRWEFDPVDVDDHREKRAADAV
jgi:hypothetical protein